MKKINRIQIRKEIYRLLREQEELSPAEKSVQDQEIKTQEQINLENDKELAQKKINIARNEIEVLQDKINKIDQRLAQLRATRWFNVILPSISFSFI